MSSCYSSKKLELFFGDDIFVGGGDSLKTHQHLLLDDLLAAVAPRRSSGRRNINTASDGHRDIDHASAGIRHRLEGVPGRRRRASSSSRRIPRLLLLLLPSAPVAPVLALPAAVAAVAAVVEQGPVASSSSSLLLPLRVGARNRDRCVRVLLLMISVLEATRLLPSSVSSSKPLLRLLLQIAELLKRRGCYVWIGSSSSGRKAGRRRRRVVVLVSSASASASACAEAQPRDAGGHGVRSRRGPDGGRERRGRGGRRDRGGRDAGGQGPPARERLPRRRRRRRGRAPWRRRGRRSSSLGLLPQLLIRVEAAWLLQQRKRWGVLRAAAPAPVDVPESAVSAVEGG